VVAKGRRVLSVGVNRNRNNPANMTNPKVGTSVHAEMAAIRTLEHTDVDWSRVTLYVARTGHRMSKPCQNCQLELDRIGIRRVVWTH